MTAQTKPLTPKQARFVDEYVIDFCASTAAKRAGYSDRTSRQIGFVTLSLPHVQAAIAAKVAERAARTKVDQDYVVSKLVGIVERATGDDFQGGVANGALALLAKHVGGFTDRVDHTTNGKPLPAAITVTLVKPK